MRTPDLAELHLAARRAVTGKITHVCVETLTLSPFGRCDFLARLCMFGREAALESMRLADFDAIAIRETSAYGSDFGSGCIEDVEMGVR